MPEAVEGDPMSDARCDSCGGPARVWFAPSALWNLVMGGPDAKGDPGGMLCPNCFVDRAEAVWRKPTAWKIAPETDDDTENAKTISALRAALSRAEAEREEAQIAWKKIASFTEMHWQGAGAKLCGDWLYEEIVRRAHEGSRAEEALDDIAQEVFQIALCSNTDDVVQKVAALHERLSRTSHMEET